jgi:hypothetical protein
LQAVSAHVIGVTEAKVCHRQHGLPAQSPRSHRSRRCKRPLNLNSRKFSGNFISALNLSSSGYSILDT